MNDSPPYFRLRAIRKSFGKRLVLRDVTLDFPTGKTTVVLGGSGTGKSVLLKHLNGLISPDAGSVSVLSEDITHRSEESLASIRRRIGFVFQDGALFDSLTVGENIVFPLREYGERDPELLRKKRNAILEELNLEGEAAKNPGSLSGGMKKRVALARALIVEPECLLCDEPTAGLDPILSETVARLIRRATVEKKLTSVVVTHDLGAMRIMADHVVFLHEGEVLFEGGLDALYATGNERIDSFLAASGGGG